MLLLTYLVQDAVDNALGSNSFPVFVFPLIVLVMFILYAPTMPRLYPVRFAEKFRPGILARAIISGLLSHWQLSMCWPWFILVWPDDTLDDDGTMGCIPVI
jgi:hypothetical protein